MTLGEKLQALRKGEGLSQEALAEKVSVTRQTISKWELDQSMPDLDFIAQLSDIFHVSADYLIKGELTTPDELPFRKRTYRFSPYARRIMFALLSAAALVAVWVCLVCDYFTAGGLSWSWIAVVSIAAAWLLLLPILTARDNILLKTLLAASVVPFPLLAALAFLLREPVVFTLGACIALVSVAVLWVIYGIFRKCRGHVWRGFGFALLVFIPVPIAILYVIALFFPQAPIEFRSSLFNNAITLVLSLGCFGADYLLDQSKAQKV